MAQSKITAYYKAMIKTKSRLFNISSTVGRMNGAFCSQIQVDLPDLTFHLDHVQNAYLSVVHAEVANSFYIVNYTNNQFVLNGTTYTLTRGNYNVNTFIVMLLALLPVGYGLTYNSATTKLTMTNTTTDFTVNASSINSTVNSIMGLGTSDITSAGLTLTFPNVVNFIPLQRINFRSNYFNFGCYSTSDGSSDIFLPLQNNAGQNSVINYNNQTQSKFLIQDRNITSFVISVTNDDNQLINFNGVDWYMTIQIDIDYLETPRPANNTFNFAQRGMF
jgi:hypothetical protein